MTHLISKRAHYRGALNGDDEPHGSGTLFFPDGSRLQGKFVDGQIEGVATYTQPDDSRIVGPYVDGVLSGEVVEYDEEGAEVFRGMYVDSVREGFGTLTLPDHGALVGEWRGGVFEGEKNKYIYPRALPLEASLRGQWKEGEMKRARFYIGETPFDRLDALPDTKLLRPIVREKADLPVWYRSDESTATRISSDRLLSDPFERLLVRVAPSTMGATSGEGLFARLPLPADTVVTWYNGVREPAQRTERRKWEDNSNSIALVDDVGARGDVDIDVPAKWASTATYCASLAHKCNHTFDLSQRNAAYCMALHPRFGLIKAIRTLRSIRVDEELLVDYGYNLPLDKEGNIRGRAGPAWWREAQKRNKQEQAQQAEEREAEQKKRPRDNTAAAPAAAAAAAAAEPASAKRRKR